MLFRRVLFCFDQCREGKLHCRRGHSLSRQKPRAHYIVSILMSSARRRVFCMFGGLAQVTIEPLLDFVCFSLPLIVLIESSMRLCNEGSAVHILLVVDHMQPRAIPHPSVSSSSSQYLFRWIFLPLQSKESVE
jgi:hypothetical protein